MDQFNMPANSCVIIIIILNNNNNNNSNNNNNNSLLTLLALKNWINSEIYNWTLIIKSIYNNKYYNNNN